MYSIEQINDAIARKINVYATHSDLRRAGQPNPGQEVRLTKAFEDMHDGRIKANASGYKGRFAVTNIRIEGVMPLDTTPDTY